MARWLYINADLGKPYRGSHSLASNEAHPQLASTLRGASPPPFPIATASTANLLNMPWEARSFWVATTTGRLRHPCRADRNRAFTRRATGPAAWSCEIREGGVRFWCTPVLFEGDVPEALQRHDGFAMTGEIGEDAMGRS